MGSFDWIPGDERKENFLGDDLMSKRPLFHVKKHNLLAIAGCVCMIAGFNVARLSILSYRKILPFSAIHIVLSIIVFCALVVCFIK